MHSAISGSADEHEGPPLFEIVSAISIAVSIALRRAPCFAKGIGIDLGCGSSFLSEPRDMDLGEIIPDSSSPSP